MSYDARVFNVMIASPSDVVQARTIARDVIYEWNAVNSNFKKIVLLPAGWETHGSPEMGASAQDIINRQVLDKCDLLIGVFWTRLGTSTRDYASGTVEEIEKHVKSGKPAMLYFSNEPVRLDSVDASQYEKLKEFRRASMQEGLVETYDTLADFRDRLYRQLQLRINEDHYFQVAGYESSMQSILLSDVSLASPLSSDAKTLLKEASLDKEGVILHLKTLGGTRLATNGKDFTHGNERREVARWEAALNELLEADLIQDRGRKGEVFELTDRGYKVADITERPPDDSGSDGA